MPDEGWLRALQEAGRVEAIVDPPGASLDVATRASLSIPSTPGGHSLTVRNVGYGGGAFTIATKRQLPHSIEICCAPHLETLHFEGDAWGAVPPDWLRGQTVLRATGVERTLSVTGRAPFRLSIVGGQINFGLEGGFFLGLHDTSVSAEQELWIPQLILSGRVVLDEVQMSTGFTSVQGSVWLILGESLKEGKSNLRLGQIAAPDEGPVNVYFTSGHAELSNVPPFSRISLYHARLRIAASKDTLENLTISGDGMVQIDSGKLLRAEFRSGDWASSERLHLVIGYEGAVLDAIGSCGDLTVRGVCTGRPGKYALRPLGIAASRPLGIDAAEGGRLQDLNMYALDVPDLRELESTERLSPWIPGRLLAKKLEDNQRMGVSDRTGSFIADAHTRLRERAHFWAKLAELLKKKHTPGSVQARVRYAAMRTRAKMLPRFSRERTLLRVYWLIGYGERIGQPLFLHSLLTLFASLLIIRRPWAFDIGRIRVWGDIGKAWLRMLFAPVSFFRVGPDAPQAQLGGVWGQIVLTLVTGLGIALIFFALSATRRITKAE